MKSTDTTEVANTPTPATKEELIAAIDTAIELAKDQTLGSRITTYLQDAKQFIV